MLEKTLSVLLIEDNSEYADLVEVWFSERPDMQIRLVRAGSLTSGLDRLSEGGIDAILLDLELPDSFGGATFYTVHAHAEGIPVLLLTAAQAESLALEFVVAGAEDYLIKERCSADTLVRAVLYAVLRRSRNGAAPEPRPAANIVGVLGAKGGSGTTTFACNLAAELMEISDGDAVLVDLDLDRNAVAFQLGLNPRYTVLDAVQNRHRVDKAVMDSLLCRGPEDLRVLASPALRGEPGPPAAHLNQLVLVLRLFYRWVVLDLGVLNATSRRLLDSANEILMVTGTSVPSLYQAKQALASFQSGGIPAEKMHLVLADVFLNQRFSRQDYASIFGFPVSAHLPASPIEVAEATAKANLIARQSPYRAAVQAVASQLAGVPIRGKESEPSPGFSFRKLLKIGEPKKIPA